MLRRLFWYRFAIFIEETNNASSLHVEGWAYQKLREKTPIEYITDEYKRRNCYVDVNIWPVPFAEWDAYCSRNLTRSSQERHELL